MNKQERHQDAGAMRLVSYTHARFAPEESFLSGQVDCLGNGDKGCTTGDSFPFHAHPETRTEKTSTLSSCPADDLVGRARLLNLPDIIKSLFVSPRCPLLRLEPLSQGDSTSRQRPVQLYTVLQCHGREPPGKGVPCPPAWAPRVPAPGTLRISVLTDGQKVNNKPQQGLKDDH